MKPNPPIHFTETAAGGVKDPSGNFRWIATHTGDVPSEEMQKRVEAAMSQRSGS